VQEPKHELLHTANYEAATVMTENGRITAGTTTFEGGLNLRQKQLMMQSCGIYSDCSTGEMPDNR